MGPTYKTCIEVGVPKTDADYTVQEQSVPCCWYAIGGQHIYTSAMQHRKEKEPKNHPLPHGPESLKALRFETPLCPYGES